MNLHVYNCRYFSASILDLFFFLEEDIIYTDYSLCSAKCMISFFWREGQGAAAPCPPPTEKSLFSLQSKGHNRLPIFHSDGTYLAKIGGNRSYPTDAGRKANIEIRDTPDKFSCSLENNVIFELSHGVGSAFKADAELYTPDGFLVKCSDTPNPELFD